MQQSQKGFSNRLPSSPNLTVEIPPLSMHKLGALHEENKPMAPRHAKDQKHCCADGCKKKLGLTDFPCKCGKKHCVTHRIPELHGCTFDFKANQKDILLQTMSTPVIAKKIDVL